MCACVQRDNAGRIAGGRHDTLTVNGPGRDKLTIDARQPVPCVHPTRVQTRLTISKLTIVNGRYDNPYDYSTVAAVSVLVGKSSRERTVSSCYYSSLGLANGGAIFAHSGSDPHRQHRHRQHGTHATRRSGCAAGQRCSFAHRSTVSDNTASSRRRARQGRRHLCGRSVPSRRRFPEMPPRRRHPCQFLGTIPDRQHRVGQPSPRTSGVVEASTCRSDVRNSTIANTQRRRFPCGLYTRRVRVTPSPSCTARSSPTTSPSGVELDVGTRPGDLLLVATT